MELLKNLTSLYALAASTFLSTNNLFLTSPAANRGYPT
jgi:hypothetical protein